MRTGLSTIQQTLTPEAASVLNHSIAEAGRRNHGQTTPLHVAATLLSSPSGFLRQACIRSHPNSSHPLQCRALELCFSVALERLPAAQGNIEPPISNSLMAALKRAQAHQRRGSPEQQQQPLLAVKVELEQLIISILDDPSVSRVMREASFSSPAVKSTIEQIINSNSSASCSNPISFRPMTLPNRNLYLNPRLQQGYSNPSSNSRNDEVRKVLDIFLKMKKRNPILVGDSEPGIVIKEVLRIIEKREIQEGPLKNVEVISIYKDQITTKINDLICLIEGKIGNGCGVILDLGDLKWLVEQPAGAGNSGGLPAEIGRVAVVEMGKLLARFAEEGGGGNSRVWLIGIASCETYLRCQVYHPLMENEWDLQAVPIASRSPSIQEMLSRPGPNGILSSSLDSLNPMKNFSKIDSPRRTNFCPKCTQNYETELARLLAEKSDGSLSVEPARPALPSWLQNTRLSNPDAITTDLSQDQESVVREKTRELQKKWRNTCLSLHLAYHNNLGSERTSPNPLSLSSLYNPKLQPTRNLQETLPKIPLRRASPVRTDLILGPTHITENTPKENTEEGRVKDFLGCISSKPQPKFSNASDADSFKKLLKGLMEKAWWQPEAAATLAAMVMEFKYGNGNRSGPGSKGNNNKWLLFAGPDRVGKKKMASMISEHVCGSTSLTMICLGSRRDDEEIMDLSFRGKTVLDRIAEAVRRNPFSVIMLQDIDETDMLVRGSIKRAMERGRLSDSYGREISLGNVIFILTGNWSPVAGDEGGFGDEPASGGWQLRLTIGEKSSKRRANWLNDEKEERSRHKREMGSNLSLDLNLSVADTNEDRTDGSHNSSDLTVENEDVENSILLPRELVDFVDGTILFKPVNIGRIRREIEKTISKTFSAMVNGRITVEVVEEVVERIHAGIWFGRTSLQEWVERVLGPAFRRLGSSLVSAGVESYESRVVWLELDPDSGDRREGEWMPSVINVVDGV